MGKQTFESAGIGTDTGTHGCTRCLSLPARREKKKDHEPFHSVNVHDQRSYLAHDAEVTCSWGKRMSKCYSSGVAIAKKETCSYSHFLLLSIRDKVGFAAVRFCTQTTTMTETEKMAEKDG